MLQAVRFWPELITAVGRPDLATDERFTSPEALFANREEGTRILDEIFAHSHATTSGRTSSPT